MKRIEVKSLGITSVFKTTIYFTSASIGIIFAIGLIVLIVGIGLASAEAIIFGLAYMILPVFMLFIYGLIAMLSGLIYNLFAKKFGGLELTIEEKIEAQPYNYHQY